MRFAFRWCWNWSTFISIKSKRRSEISVEPTETLETYLAKTVRHEHGRFIVHSFTRKFNEERSDIVLYRGGNEREKRRDFWCLDSLSRTRRRETEQDGVARVKRELSVHVSSETSEREKTTEKVLGECKHGRSLLLVLSRHGRLGTLSKRVSVWRERISD